MEMQLCCDCEPPPVLLGRIYRFVYPSFPSDYAGIATASWSSGTTGNPTEDFNCRYVTLSTPNRRETSAEIITDPVRFSIYGPASDGGTFDYWYGTGGPLRYFQFGLGLGLHPVTDVMLPSGSHVEFVDGELSLDSQISQAFPLPRTASIYTPNLSTSNFITDTITFHAFAHRVNGSIVGSVHVAPFSAADYLCPITDGDTYEVDVWYKLSFTASPSLPATPGAVNRWLHTTRISNGSRRRIVGDVPRYLLSFLNANFSPNFNPETHTYQVSISGHTGWTLLAGSNGPMTIQSYPGYWTGAVGDGFAILQSVGLSHPVTTIFMAWNREVATASIKTFGDTIFHPQKAYVYRSTTASPSYRSQTESTDMGSVSHVQYGLFNQAGTTVFEYIESNFGAEGSHDGYYTNASLPTKPPELPQTITFTRISKSVSEQIYTSGSGTFIVPDGVFLLTRELWGPGGGGAAGESGGGDRSGSGGSGGGYCKKNATAVTPGQAIAYSVGVPGTGGTYDNDDSTAGTATTTDGGTYTANGGGRGRFGGGVAADPGGSASGGDINTTGTTGSTNPTATVGGDGGAGANGGAGGAGANPGAALAQNGAAPGGGGGGGGDNGAFGGGDTADAGDGGAGKIRFSW